MSSGKRDMRAALQNRVALVERPHIVQAPGERFMATAKYVSVQLIKPNPAQPRKIFDAEALDELAGSIRDRGVMQPLVVRPMGDDYSIIMGERRYRAAILAGLDEVPVIIRDTSDEQAFIDALIENLQRASLTAEEEAEAYKGLLNRGYSGRQIAEKLSIAHTKVSRVVRIYEDPLLSQAIMDGQLTKSQAQELLVAPEEEKPRLVQFIAGRRKQKQSITLRELRTEVGQARNGGALRPIHPEQAPSGALRTTPHNAGPGAPEDPALTRPAPPIFNVTRALEQARALRETLEKQPTLCAHEGMAMELQAIVAVWEASGPADGSTS